MNPSSSKPRSSRRQASPAPRVQEPDSSSSGTVVVSPHLDDAVFACGDLLVSKPGSVVVTVFAGRPSCPVELTGWDADAGFREGDDVVALRRAEDLAALRMLGATPVWLDFLDAQYGPSPATSTIAECLAHSVTASGVHETYMPLGLFHSDHRLTARACLAAMRIVSGIRWFAYAEALYRRIPGLMQRRLAALDRVGIRAMPLPPTRRDASESKRRAIAAYASQIRALGTPGRLGHEDAFEPEQIWRLECR